MTATLPNFWQPTFATIRAITPETPGVQTYDIAFDGVPPLPAFRPGQFNMMYLPGLGESAISMSSDPAEVTTWRHTVRAVGNVTRGLTKLQIGDTIGVRGPFGTAWPVDEFHGHDVILVAGGIGLAPLRPAIYHLIRHRANYGRVTLLYGARTPADLLYSTEYAAWIAGGIDVQTTVDVGSPKWTGSIGVVTVLLNRLPIDASRTVVMTCGPDVMMRFVGRAAVGRGIPRNRVFVSLERNMNCAVGLCGHCQFGPDFVCKDGPVFPLDRVEKLMGVENF